MSSTENDLNAYDGALDYDGFSLHTADPGTDGASVAAGGEVQAIVMGALGAAGPSLSVHPATPGRSYGTAAAVFPLTEAATWAGLWVGAEFRKGYPLRMPVGPGTVSLVPAVQVRASDRS